ncbi:hypothetical protein MJO29_013278 [Puccinia striiformis f. sp. tritici]|uniref:C2 domain-containing protein n=1 Tax=Puccinia striiformis f. sp. tritici PST-78 TaxID=1165861 RepID=A0A0L0VMW3_9BASI|nr:hypothetical protein Pst134EA_024710 [Puccinia striiformis f. sp. tritici]KAH9445119.1 hypothetical protein Pst134EB_025368 [Puccinia striiformis f. sp. tritici]KAH9453844.1 hypothetical protein Pst134EA_024710 [Puccinia striiformis f. sp. tritici]KAI7943434.1 hypothetical protein MJO29_013278 [Puccinia striiformis f. sp. tritici]KNF00365.1 hypothetical protein PSTG_06295 [Puccinia striiformis f. sp. tritici PST-78]
MNPLSSRITLFAITALLLSLCTSASKKRKCRGTLNSDAYGNSWEKANVVWKSPKHQKEGVVEATIHGRIDIPTNDGSTIQSHVCYATVKVNITDCSMVLGKNATADQGWDLHKSPIYRNQDTWNWNETLTFRPDCPENIHVEVFEP